MTDNQAAGIIQAIESLDGTMSEIMVTLEEIADILQGKENAAASSAKADSGVAEQTLTGPVTASSIQKN